MKRIKFKLIALILVVAMLFSGCALDFIGYFNQLANVFRPVTFENMTYTRPDPALLEDALSTCLTSAGGKNLDRLLSDISSFNSICSRFQTHYYLAYIHYSIDTTDAYWAEEYNYCSRFSPTIQASVDELMYALADSPLREKLEADEYFGAGYFDQYEGESLWTDEFMDLKNQETELINQYYALSSATQTDYTTLQMEQLYVALVQVRQEMATEAGYDSYAAFAYDFTYNRDYTPAQANALVSDIRKELVELYKSVAGSRLWFGMTTSSEEETFSYVQSMSQSMGGMVQSAFSAMEYGGLYHISYGENKINASYTTYLPDYQVPFVFMNPTMTSYDHLTFAHEFGHFCNYYATGGANGSVDVAEVFSQGLELLSTFYADGGKEIEQIKLADALGSYIDQSFLSDFENRVYQQNPQDLTIEKVRQLYSQTAKDFGLDGAVAPNGYIIIPHLFTSPMYVISYVVSQDAAMQFYQLEKEKSGEGLSRYEENLASTQSGYLAFLQEAKLESPFTEGHVAQLRKVFENALNI